MDKILVIIVLYKKKIQELEYLKNLKDVSILFYDNSPISQEITETKNLYYINDVTNPGVSKAYNEGARLAKKLNKKYILLLDQDTTFSRDGLLKYIELEKKYGVKYIYSSVIGNEKLIYSPALEMVFNNKAVKKDEFKYKELFNINKKAIINTGLMISLEIFNKIGGFNEKIKLDFSDTYFIEKYKELNSEIILVNNFLSHSLSGNEGKDISRELNRFNYYCEGAREIRKAIKNKLRITKLIYLRMIKLVLKYKSINPIISFYKYYIGDKKI